MSLQRRTSVVQCVVTFLVLSIGWQCVKVKGHDSADFGNEEIYPLDLEQLRVANFLVGISLDGIRLSNASDTQCAQQLGHFLAGVKEHKPWALKVVDSFGVAPKTVSWGNYFWFSSKEYCEDLNTPYRISLSERYNHSQHFNDTSPFPFRFWMVYFNFTSPLHVDLNLQFENTIHVGLCLPKICTHDEIFIFSNHYFARKVFEQQRTYKIDMTAIEAKSPSFQWTVFLKGAFLTFFGVLLTLAVLISIAKFIHRVHKNQAMNKDMKLSAESYTKVEQFFLCFDLSDNYQRMMRLESSKGFLPVIAGFRTIVCLWVTLFHVYFYSLFSISNVPLIFAKLETMVLQPVLQSCFYVDVFFVMSSFLLFYNFLSNSKNMDTIKKNSLKENVKFYLRLVLNRYVRFLPIMLVTMLLSDCMFEFLNVYSPFRMDQYTGLYCKKNWWYNILFINNFLDLKEICASWTWYLGCEMQYFILFTLLLFIYAKNEKMGKSVFMGLCVSFLGISFLCNYFNGVTFQIDVIYGTLEHVYVAPWVRINPYFGGAIMGWLFYQHKENPIKFKRVWKLIFWSFTLCLYMFTNVMSFWKSTPTWLVASIMSFGKLIFALCVGCVIIMCEWGYGGYLNTLMSSRPFLFLNKFCFCIYMVSPVLVVTVFGLRTEATRFNEVSSSMDFMGIIVMSILMSFIIVLLVEIPFQKISSKFIMRRKVA